MSVLHHPAEVGEATGVWRQIKRVERFMWHERVDVHVASDAPLAEALA